MQNTQQGFAQQLYRPEWNSESPAGAPNGAGPEVAVDACVPVYAAVSIAAPGAGAYPPLLYDAPAAGPAAPAAASCDIAYAGSVPTVPAGGKLTTPDVEG
jgi:hypothetical protein